MNNTDDMDRTLKAMARTIAFFGAFLYSLGVIAYVAKQVARISRQNELRHEAACRLRTGPLTREQWDEVEAGLNEILVKSPSQS